MLLAANKVTFFFLWDNISQDFISIEIENCKDRGLIFLRIKEETVKNDQR